MKLARLFKTAVMLLCSATISAIKMVSSGLTTTNIQVRFIFMEPLGVCVNVI